MSENTDNKDDKDNNLKNGADRECNDNDTADDSILPHITPEILVEYQKESAMREAGAAGGRRRERGSLLHVCGVPSWLMLILIVLTIAVIVGAVLGVVLQDTDGGIQPPSDAPSLTPTMRPS
jgi:hypothetical protein